MGTFGQALGSVIGGVIGGVVGYFVGAPFQGAMIGMSIGGQLGLMIDPPDAPPPPPFGDLGLNSFVKSSPITLAFGQNKLYGGVIWLGSVNAEWDNEGSRKNPEWSPEMDVDYAVANCEGEVISYLQYFIDDKPVGDLEQEGLHFNFTSYLGSAGQSVDPTIDAFQSGKAIPAIPFKYTAYTVCRLHVEDKILNKLPSVSAEIKGWLTESGEEDANPIRCVYEFMTNTRWGIGLSTDNFNGDPDTVGSPWKAVSDYCDELVQFTDWDDSLVDEPRFRYSNTFDARSKGFDILTNMLNTCRGMIRLKQGQFEPLIENPDEEVTRYYSDRHKENFTAGGSSTINRLYADFSAYSDIYWYGDEGVITISDIDYYFVVKDQTSTYIDLFDDLSVSPNSGDSFHIVKDNISEGSFSYKAFSKQEKSNVFRVEFINRKVKDKDDVFKNLYQWEAYDYDRPITYKDPVRGQIDDSVKIKTLRMKGIKRKSQAMRVAQNFGDYADAINHFCELTTGHGGYIHGVGDIIGISHAQTGWDGKEFRIVAMDETENDEIKLECIAYSRFIFSDIIPKVTHVDNNATTSPYEAPNIIERFSAVQDLTENKIWLRFKRPDDNPYLIGANVYVSIEGGDYWWAKQVGTYTPSVKLDSLINDTVTVIPFDDTTLYGSFPDSGSFWIEDELITYTSIDDINHEFEGCTRGSNATSHTNTKYCDLKQTLTPSIDFLDYMIGQSWEIKLVAINIESATANFSTSPTNTTVIE